VGIGKPKIISKKKIPGSIKLAKETPKMRMMIALGAMMMIIKKIKNKNKNGWLRRERKGYSPRKVRLLTEELKENWKRE
jgi:hypothetical protein